jgi:hypothetical protein
MVNHGDHGADKRLAGVEESVLSGADGDLFAGLSPMTQKRERARRPKDEVYNLIGEAAKASLQGNGEARSKYVLEAIKVWYEANARRPRGRPAFRCPYTSVALERIGELVRGGMANRPAVRQVAREGLLTLHSERSIDTVLKHCINYFRRMKIQTQLLEAVLAQGNNSRRIRGKS